MIKKPNFKPKHQICLELHEYISSLKSLLKEKAVEELQIKEMQWNINYAKFHAC
jgi:hypothetical protein